MSVYIFIYFDKPCVQHWCSNLQFESCQQEIEQLAKGDVTSDQLDEMLKRAIEWVNL